MILSSAQTLSRLLAFAVTVYLARVLGADSFGATVLGLAVLAYLSLLVDLGFGAMGPLEVARGGFDVRRLAESVITLRLLLSGLAAAALVLFARLSGLDRPTQQVLLLYGLSLPTTALDLSWAMVGAGRMRAVGLGEVVSQGVYAAGIFLFVSGPDHLARVPLLYLAGRLAQILLVGAAFARLYGIPRPGFDRALIKDLLPATLKFTGGAWVGTLLVNFDLVLVGLWLGNRAAGLYGAACRVVWAPTLLATAYFTALRPALARSSGDGLAAIAPFLRRSIRVSASLAVGVVAGGVFLARPIVALLFGPGYDAAAVPLQVLLVAFGLLVVSRHYRSVLLAFERPGLDLAIMGVAASGNVALNLALLPRLGLVGAALATLASEALILVATRAATARGLGRRPVLDGLMKPALSAIAMLVFLAASEPLPVVVRVLLAGALYVVLLRALRVIGPEDLASLK